MARKTIDQMYVYVTVDNEIWETDRFLSDASPSLGSNPQDRLVDNPQGIPANELAEEVAQDIEHGGCHVEVIRLK